MHGSFLLPAFSSPEQLLPLPCSAALKEAVQMPDNFSTPCNLPQHTWQQWKPKPRAGEGTNTISSKVRQSCYCYAMVGGESLSHHPRFLQTPPLLLSKVLVDFKESRGDQSLLHPTRQIFQKIRFSGSDLIYNVWGLFSFFPPRQQQAWPQTREWHRDQCPEWWAASFLTDRRHTQRQGPFRATTELQEHNLWNHTEPRHGISCWMLPCGPTVHNQLNWLDGCCSPQLLWFALSSKLLFASFCTTQASSLCRHAVARLLPLHYHAHVSGWVQASLVKL